MSAGPWGTVASGIIVGKYCDNLPLYRQEQIYATRHGVDIPRHSMARWLALAADWLTPVYDHIRSSLMAAGYVQVSLRRRAGPSAAMINCPSILPDTGDQKGKSSMLGSTARLTTGFTSFSFDLASCSPAMRSATNFISSSDNRSKTHPWANFAVSDLGS